MRIYSHWLDGCYVRALTNGLAPVERSLKLHALLGDTLVLSDVQLIDSPIVSRLFADNQFRAFLAGNPNFLELVSDTDQAAVDTFALVTQGLRRTEPPGWIPSGTIDRSMIRELAELVLTSGGDLAAILGSKGGRELRGRWPQHENRMRGIVNCLSYFVEHDEAVRQTRTDKLSRESYYGVLLEMVDRGLRPKHREAVEQTIEWIHENIKDPALQPYRSEVLSRLPYTDKSDLAEMVRNTVTQAWNCAVETTLAPEGGSASRLPFAPPLAAYRNSVYNGLLPIQNSKTRSGVSMIHRHLEQLPWDPHNIDWDELARIAVKIRTSQDTYQRAKVTRDDSETHALRRLVRDMAHEMPAQRRRAIASATTLLLNTAVAGVGGTLGVLIGSSPEMGAAIAGGGVLASSALQALGVAWTEFAVVNTLSRSLSDLRRDPKEELDNDI